MTKEKIKNIDWRKWAERILPYLAIILLTTLMISWQLRKRATFITADSYLHFYRFYDTKMQLLTGNFSYFQTNYGFYHSGRIFNAVYGPLFAYFNGFLVIICRTWFKYKIAVDYLLFLTAGMGCYHLGLKAKVNRLYALLLALIYLQFGLMPGFLRANNFMAWGGALAPFVMMQAVNLVTDKKRPLRHWLCLAILIALMAQIHMLSTVLLVLTLVPFFIIAWIKTNHKKQLWFDLDKAVGLCLLLTANIWSALLFLSKTNTLALPKAFNLWGSTVKMSLSVSSHGHILPFMVMLLVLQLIYLIFNWRDNELNWILTGVSVIIIFVASKYFPWHQVQAVLPVLRRSFQFPYRLTVGAWPLFLTAVGLSLTQLTQKYGTVMGHYLIVGLLLVLLQNFGANLTNNRKYSLAYSHLNHVVTMGTVYKINPDRWKIQQAVHESNGGELFNLVSRSEPDFLPVKPGTSLKKVNHLYRKKIIDQEANYRYQVKGDKLYLTWQQTKAKQRLLPVVTYSQSQLAVNGHHLSKFKKNAISQPEVLARKGQNQAVLSFKVPAYFWLALIVTCLSWLAVAASYLVSKLKIKKS
jgi:hypothetical protein